MEILHHEVLDLRPPILLVVIVGILALFLSVMIATTMNKHLGVVVFVVLVAGVFFIKFKR